MISSSEPFRDKVIEQINEDDNLSLMKERNNNKIENHFKIKNKRKCEIDYTNLSTNYI